MTKIMARWIRFLRDEEGPAAVEYTVMLSLLVIGCVSAISMLGF